ncbi:DUF4215 domain-containing protein [Candidatus Peregrinibacteria bacterium]|nr:MAG: DUF4215 domain-containing protein [Candidatus Peregrinibacteria bacterium]
MALIIGFFGVLASALLVSTAEQAGTTFSLTANTVPVGQYPTTLTLDIDPNAESAGLLGAEVHLSYDPNLLSIQSISTNCGFNSCLDFSESGTLKFLGASGLQQDGGQILTTTQTFATLQILAAQSSTLTFSKCSIITNQASLATCTALPFTIQANGTVSTSCGNATLDTGETCDDGNTVNGDGCSSVCALETGGGMCGNSAVDTGETCDDGNTVNGDGCSSVCALEICGNGILNFGEQCDDGNQIDTDSCTNTCTNTSLVLENPICGNLVIEGSEQCDDGNDLAGDGCNQQCLLEVIRREVALDFLTFKTVSGVKSALVGKTLPLITNAHFTDESVQNITQLEGVIYSSSKPTVATIEQGNLITKRKGTTTFFVSYSTGGVTRNAQFSFTVTEPAPEPVPVAPVEPVKEPETPPVVEAPPQEDPSNEPLRPAAHSLTEGELGAIASASEVVESGAFVDQFQLDLPDSTQTIDHQIESCTGNGYFKGIDLSTLIGDADGDGLTDRSECYVGTNPRSYDTDRDGCSDGEEVNLLATNPTRAGDCDAKAESEAEPIKPMVSITDPQQGWIVRSNTPRLAGVVSRNATQVELVAFHADQSALAALKKVAEQLAADPRADLASSLMDELDNRIKQLNAFWLENGDFFDYGSLNTLIRRVSDIATQNGAMG